MEKITVDGAALPVYKFTLPAGAVFRDYAAITGQFFVDGDNYDKNARLRAYGNYAEELFSEKDSLFFLNFSVGKDDKNAPYLLCNVYGNAYAAIDTISSGAGPNAWFKLDFPFKGKRDKDYKPENFPADNASGDFYFALGLCTDESGAALSYYAKEIALVSEDGTRKVFASESAFAKPAFAGYITALPELRREKITQVEEKPSPRDAGGPVEITVGTSVRHQYVSGFGGMSNAWNSPKLTEDDITAMYGEGGLGFNIFRIILYHEPSRWGELLPLAKKTKEYGAAIVACPWTPPVHFKSNDLNIGGHLLPQHYADYAQHLRSFVNYMAENGAGIDVISFQNEPDIQVGYDSCDWTPEQMLDFVKKHGRETGDAKIIPGESFQFKRNFTDPMLTDPQAVQNFDIIGGHIYGGGLEPYPLAAEKGKEVWMTEHLRNNQGNFLYDLTWNSAMAVAKEIHECMAANFSAYIWWYLKRFYSVIGDGEYGSAEGQVLRKGYVISHYAKYAAGKQRIEAKSSGNPNVLVTAYEGGGSISMVIVNAGSKPSDAAINLQGEAAVSAVESTDGSFMVPKTVISEPGKISISLKPQSIVSLAVG